MQTGTPETFQDVREVGKHNLPLCDMLVGGFPCQDLSVAGKRAGLAGERSGLFWEFVRIASELHPEWLVLENVPGLLSSNEGRDMGTVIGGLEDIGYCCCWRVLDSQYFGVAQRRRRVFIVGHSRIERAVAVLFEPDGGAGNPQTVRNAGQDVAGTLDGSPPCSRQRCDSSDNYITTFNWQAGKGRGGNRTHDKPTLICEQTPAVAYAIAENQRHELRASTLPGAIAKPSGGLGQGIPTVAYNIIGSGQEGRNHAYETERTGALQSKGNSASGNEAGTIISSPADPDGVRETPRLPAGMDGRRYRQLGNAVTVQVMEWIARRIVMVGIR